MLLPQLFNLIAQLPDLFLLVGQLQEPSKSDGAECCKLHTSQAGTDDTHAPSLMCAPMLDETDLPY